MKHIHDDTTAWVIDQRGPHRHHRGRRGFGPGGPGGPGPFGPGGFGPGGPGGRGRGGRSRGDVRAAILILLAEQPRHGYDLIRAIEERTSGAWAPSPGSIYPTLQVLEDEGLVSIAEVDGRRTASLTDEGKAWVDSHADEQDHVFERARGGAEATKLREEIGALTEAAVHVARRSDAEDAPAKVTAILADARREIYRLLAEQE